MKGGDLIEKILWTGERHVDEVEVFLVQGRSVGTEIKQAILGTAEESQSWSLTIRTIKDGRIGISSTSDPDRWKECLEASCASGRIASPQQWGGLPKPVDMVSSVPSSDQELVVDAENAAGLIRQLLEGAAEHPVEVAGGSASLSRSFYTIANTSGVRYGMERTLAAVSLETIKEQSTGYEFDVSPFVGDIDARSVGAQAALLSARSLGAGEMATGRYDVILSPLAAAHILSQVLVPAISGRNVKAGRSFLADKLGEQVFDETLAVYDDPFVRGIGSANWDAEGVPTRRLEFVRQGVLRCFAYDLKTAYRYGEESTGSAVRSGGEGPGIGIHNLIIDGPRSRNLNDERAIWVHDVVGAHTANPFSGDFSVELSNPFWTEGGELTAPIRTAMFAGNVFEMLKQIGGLGSDSRIVGRMIIPSIRLNNQQIIGK
jgi:PmbA protein